MGRLALALLFCILHIHLSTQYYANLCFNRKINMNCEPEGRGFINGTMTISSVTILLSSDGARLQNYNDGKTCTAVEFECRTTIRESNKDVPDRYDPTMIQIYELVMSKCDQKTSCYLEVPNYTAVRGTSYNCLQRFPDIQNFYLRGIYLDITCARPMPTTTLNTTGLIQSENTTESATTTTPKQTTEHTKREFTTQATKDSTKSWPGSSILRNGKKQGPEVGSQSTANHITVQPLVVFCLYAMLVLVTR